MKVPSSRSRLEKRPSRARNFSPVRGMVRSGKFEQALPFALAAIDDFTSPPRLAPLPTGTAMPRDVMWCNGVLRIIFCLTPMRTRRNSDIGHAYPMAGTYRLMRGCNMASPGCYGERVASSDAAS